MSKIKNPFLWIALVGAGIAVLLVVDYARSLPAPKFSRILVENERYQLSEVQVIRDIPSHAHPEGDHIHYAVAGHAVMNIGGKEVEVTPGTTTVIPANVPHSTKLLGKKLHYFHVIVYAPGVRTSMKGD